MNNLLDTHVLIWFINGENLLSAKAKQSIEHKDANNFVSIGSLWEIAIKVSLGKLSINVPFENIPEQLEKNGFQLLPITFDDTMILSGLPFHHRDPFDRLFVAQSKSNQLALISKDSVFTNYGITTMW